MKSFTQLFSITALSTALALTSPLDIPEWQDGAFSWNAAEAANIRKTRIKQRNNGLYKSVLRTTLDPEDTSTVSEVDFEFSSIDGEVLFSKTDKKADKQRTKYKEVTGLSAELEVIEYQDGSDIVMMPTMPGETTTTELGETRTKLRLRMRQNGSIVATHIGKPKFMNAFCSIDVKKKDVCSNFDGALVLGGQPLEVKRINANWSVDLPEGISGELTPDTKLIVSTTARGTNGEVLDQSTTVQTPGDDRGIELEFAYFRVGPAGGGLVVANQPANIEVEQRLDARIGTDAIDANIINVTDLPATPYREFSIPEITFIEPDNVVDMEFVLTTSFFDEIGNFMFSAQTRGTADEGESASFLQFEEPFEGPEPMSNDHLYRMTLNPDGETFSLTLGVLGENAKRAATMRVVITPDDGGSEADPAELEVAESAYLNLWLLPAAADSFDALDAVGEVDYAFSLFTDGELQDTLQGVSGTPRTIIADTPFLSMEDLEGRFAAQDDNGDAINIAIIDTGIDYNFLP